MYGSYLPHTCPHWRYHRLYKYGDCSLTLFKYLEVAACTPKPYPPNDNVTNAANAVRRFGALQMQQWEAMTQQQQMVLGMLQAQQLTHAQQRGCMLVSQQFTLVYAVCAARGFGETWLLFRCFGVCLFRCFEPRRNARNIKLFRFTQYRFHFPCMKQRDKFRQVRA